MRRVEGRSCLGGQRLHHLVVTRGLVLTEPVLKISSSVPAALLCHPLRELILHLLEQVPHLPRLVAQVVDDELENKTLSRGDTDTVKIAIVTFAGQ